MNYITLENATKSYGDKVLFQGVTIHVNEGSKVALIARNGAGKSTLMRMLCGTEPLEGSHTRLLVHQKVKIGFLEQDPTFPAELNCMEALLQTDQPAVQLLREYHHYLALAPDHPKLVDILRKMDDMKAWDMESRLQEMMQRMKIGPPSQLVSTLSGGQRKRLALASLLIAEPDCFILDEPTNHLDLDMVEWLEEYLSRPSVTVFMVTHDRWFLECVCNEILELENGNIYKYLGSYSDYLEKKSIRSETEAAEESKQFKLLKKELDWVRRQPKARTTKAKARSGRFDELKQKLDKVAGPEDLKIDFKSNRLGTKILECVYLNKAFNDKSVIKDFTYTFSKGERAGIVGPNGVGKSTLLEILTGHQKPDSGKIIWGGTIQTGYYSQKGMLLPEDKRVIDVIRDIAEYIPLEKGAKITASQILQRFLFEPAQQQVYVSQLSGGEKRRLYLLTILMANPNFLILDEPTNDLDIATLRILEDYLEQFPGCLLIVTHDRYFMDRITDHLFIFSGNGFIKDFNGTYSEYRAADPALFLPPSDSSISNTEQTKVSFTNQLTQEEQKEIRRLEKQLSELEQKKNAIHGIFASGLNDVDEIQKLNVELKQIEILIQEKELRWIELNDRQ